MQPSKYKLIAITLYVIYVILLLWITILSRPEQPEYALVNLKPFWNYHKFFTWMVFSEIALNIVLFIPLGGLGYFVMGKKSILTGCLISLFIELTQYVTCLGMCETDDVIHNAIGCAMGVFISSKLYSKRKGVR